MGGGGIGVEYKNMLLQHCYCHTADIIVEAPMMYRYECR